MGGCVGGWVHACVCVCSQASRSRATLSCDSSYFFLGGGVVKLFLAHLSQRLIGELIVYPASGVRRQSSVVHNAKTSSSQKPLGRSKPNFMWSLLG